MTYLYLVVNSETGVKFSQYKTLERANGVCKVININTPNKYTVVTKLK